MINIVTDALPTIMSLACIPMGIVLLYGKDMILLKVKANLQRKKGAKLVIDITKDKNVRFGVERLDPKTKLKREGYDVEWNHTKQYFSPQLGVQAAFVLQGTQSIFDPIGDKNIDLADGEVVDRMVRRAELMRDEGKGWMETKEQKILFAVLAVAAITLILVFMQSGQISEIQTLVAGLKGSIDAIPRGLQQVL